MTSRLKPLEIYYLFNEQQYRCLIVKDTIHIECRIFLKAIPGQLGLISPDAKYESWERQPWNILHGHKILNALIARHFQQKVLHNRIKAVRLLVNTVKRDLGLEHEHERWIKDKQIF